MRPVMLRAGGRRVRRLVVTGCVILGVLGLGAVGAHAATPSSLAGETLTSQAVKGSTFTGTCTGLGNNGGGFNFSVSGKAAGPFPGTFTESGSFTTSRSGFPSSFFSTFTINSTAGTVTGSKRLAGDNLSSATCDFLSPGEVQVSISNLATTYTATINGAQQNSGSATVNMLGILGSGPPLFSENFASNGGVVQKQCKHGGWRSFGNRFKNQGDCVSFFATRGKNPPSGS